MIQSLDVFPEGVNVGLQIEGSAAIATGARTWRGET